MPQPPPLPDPLTIAHSPDADDAFMFYALSTGKVRAPVRVEHVLSDIETLNREAERGRYHVTALSAHAYPYVRDRYRLLAAGGSVGDGYGPIVVAKRPETPADLAGRTVAIPGERTTAALALRLLVPAVRTAVVPFDRILDAVASGQVEAGLVIHEGQLTFGDQGLAKVCDLGALWSEQTSLPLPLGLNAVRRDLGEEAARVASAAIRDSVAWALAHRPEALAHALRFARGAGRERADRFVGMYVNDFTRDLGPRGRAGLSALFDRARAAGLIPDPGALDFG